MARLRRHWSKTCEPCCSSAQRSQRFSLRNSGRICTTTTVATNITEASADFHDVQDVLSDYCLSISSKSQELRREMDHHCEAITETYRQLASLNGHKAASHSRLEMVRDETRVTHLFHRLLRVLVRFSSFGSGKIGDAFLDLRYAWAPLHCEKANVTGLGDSWRFHIYVTAVQSEIIRTCYMCSHT